MTADRPPRPRAGPPSLTPPRSEPHAASWQGAERDGIWRLLSVQEQDRWKAFVALYRTVRADEGWRRPLPAAWFQALPAVPGNDPHRFVWRVRATSFRVLIARIVEPLTRQLGRPLAVVDLGAGNGWLANRLSALGHSVAAVDLDDDPHDGLGAWPNYGDPPPFLPVQASFENLPWPEESFDLAIFNGALHYAPDAGAVLGEAIRILRPRGRLAILDTPFYRHEASGRTMLEERDLQFEARHGQRSPSSHEGFLTRERLHTIGAQQAVSWQIWKPWYGLRWALRPWQNRLLGLREPARFLVIAGRPRTPSP